MQTATIDITKLDSAVKAILSDNTKLRKLPNGSEVINAGVSLAPSKRSGVVNVCPFATAACILVCVLWFAGRTVTRTVREAATKRTRLWFYDPARFYVRLHKELVALARKAVRDGVRAFCRTNVASDIDHPHEVYENHPTITFYNYTKNVEHALAYGRGTLPKNLHVAYSVSERSTFADCLALHSLGVNLVVVFDSHYFGPLHRYGAIPETVVFTNPETGESFTCEAVDGDIHDLRVPEFDGVRKCVALRAKGSKKLRETAARMGFIRHHEEGRKFYVDQHVKSGAATVELK